MDATNRNLDFTIHEHLDRFFGTYCRMTWQTQDSNLRGICQNARQYCSIVVRATKCATKLRTRFGFVVDNSALGFPTRPYQTGGYGISPDFIGAGCKIMDGPSIVGFSVRCNSPYGSVNNTLKTLWFASNLIFIFSWHCRLSQYQTPQKRHKEFLWTVPNFLVCSRFVLQP